MQSTSGHTCRRLLRRPKANPRIRKRLIEDDYGFLVSYDLNVLKLFGSNPLPALYGKSISWIGVGGCMNQYVYGLRSLRFMGDIESWCCRR